MTKNKNKFTAFWDIEFKSDISNKYTKNNIKEFIYYPTNPKLKEWQNKQEKDDKD